LSVLLDVQNAR